MSEKNIFLAEDNEENYLVVKSNIKKRKNFHLHWFKNGNQVIEALESGIKPDILLIDIQMPVMSGLELIERLKSDKRWCDYIMVALTASVFSEMKDQYIELGFDHILEKPFSRSELLELLDRYL